MTDTLIEDCRAISLDQYFFALGGDDSGYKQLTVRNCRAEDINPQSDNEFAMCFTFFPRVASSHLYVYGNYGQMTGAGAVFKIHEASYSYIYGNTFIRGANGNASRSQAVILGGRPEFPVHHTHFFDNTVSCDTSAYGALSIGQNSTHTYVHDNTIVGSGSRLFIGTALTDAIVARNRVDRILVVTAGVTLTRVQISDNWADRIDVNGLANATDVSIAGNRLVSRILFGSSGTSANVTIAENEISNGLVSTISGTCVVSNNRITVQGSLSGSGALTIDADNCIVQDNLINTGANNARCIVVNSGADNTDIVGNKLIGSTVIVDNGTDTRSFQNRTRTTASAWSTIP